MSIANNIGELIGNTPLVRINKLASNSKAEIIAKLEFFNPCSSVKDRIAYAMITDAEDKGLICNYRTYERQHRNRTCFCMRC